MTYEINQIDVEMFLVLKDGENVADFSSSEEAQAYIDNGGPIIVPHTGNKRNFS